MRLNILLFFSVLVSLGLFWTVTRRKSEEERLLRRNKFQFIKLGVSVDVLGEYKLEISNKESLMAKITEEVKTLESEAADHLAKQTANKAEVEACENAKKQITDESASLESELGNKKEEFTKQKANWEAEVASLNKQIKETSKLCNFIKTDSEVARKLCGVPDPKPDAVKNPKPEEAKAEAPKAEAPKTEAPKAEEAKSEAAEEPKVETKDAAMNGDMDKSPEEKQKEDEDELANGVDDSHLKEDASQKVVITKTVETITTGEDGAKHVTKSVTVTETVKEVDEVVQEKMVSTKKMEKHSTQSITQVTEAE